jgi:hypothetical protein
MLRHRLGCLAAALGFTSRLDGWPAQRQPPPLSFHTNSRRSSSSSNSRLPPCCPRVAQPAAGSELPALAPQQAAVGVGAGGGCSQLCCCER